MQTVMSIRKPLSILLFVISEILVILINHFLFLYLLSDHQTFAKFTLAFILCHVYFSSFKTLQCINSQ